MARWTWLLWLTACGGSSADRLAPTRPSPDPDPTSTPTRPEHPTAPTDPTDPTSPTSPTEPTLPVTERRWDCSGMDPADAAPLGGRIALTFDDGPDAVSTPVILEVLRAHGVPATFFALGERLSDPDTWPIVDEIVADPLFDLANHSWDHAELPTLSTTDFHDEVDDTTALIETWGVTPTFFRFPYGSSTCSTHDYVTAAGYRVAGWHIDTGDWCYAAVGPAGVCDPDDYWRIPPEYASDMRGWILEQVRRFDGGVVLFHDIHDWTAAELEDVILDLQGEGFTFVALDDAGAWPNLNAGTPVDLPYLGERCDVVDDRCWQVEYEAWCEPTDPTNPSSTDGVCTLPCEGYCLDRDGAATTFCATAAPGVGQCVGRSDELNAWCDAVPGSVPTVLDRHVGSSGAGATSAEVCAPQGW